MEISYKFQTTILNFPVVNRIQTFTLVSQKLRNLLLAFMLQIPFILS